jgi:4-hydroxybenzoate polyprenyltransferase
MSQKPSRIRAWLALIRFDKPIGTLLLLWPTLCALWIASGGVPRVDLLLIFILGTWLTRSAGCIANDLADRNLDGAVSRTQERPLVVGHVDINEAAMLCGVLLLLAFGLVLLTNTLTILLSFGALLLAGLYPFMKRHTHLPQVVLGAAFSWGIPMAFAAAGNSLPPELWLMFTANLLWTVAYDTEYAMVDRADDLKAGIKSTAILFADLDKLMIGILQGLALLALLLMGQRFDMGLVYHLCLVVIAALFGYQQYLLKERRPQQCFKAFLNNNYVGLVLFAGVAGDYWMRQGG